MIQELTISYYYLLLIYTSLYLLQGLSYHIIIYSYIKGITGIIEIVNKDNSDIRKR